MAQLHLHIVPLCPTASLLNTTFAAPMQAVKLHGLPALRLLWLSEFSIAAVGHNASPDLYAMTADGSWARAGPCDIEPIKAASASACSSFGSAKAMFAARASGSASGSSAAGAFTASEASDRLRHDGAITYLQPYSFGGER